MSTMNVEIVILVDIQYIVLKFNCLVGIRMYAGQMMIGCT